MNTGKYLVLMLVPLLIKGVTALAAGPISCPSLANIIVINFETAEADFQQFLKHDEAVLFFGSIDANLDTVHSNENGAQDYCDYLASRLPFFPPETTIYTYPYLGPDYTIAPTENGADIVASPEQTPEPDRTGIQLPDRWWGMMQLVALMTARNPMEGAPDTEPTYTLDTLMAEPRALANAFVHARLWDVSMQTWKVNPTTEFSTTMLAESFGTAFARTFWVAVGERMAALGYDQTSVQAALAGVHFFAVADVVPPLAHEANTQWTLLEALPTLSVMHADEDFTRYYGAQPFYSTYIPFESTGILTQGIWPLLGKRYAYVKPALGQSNVHGVEPLVLSGDPLWVDIWHQVNQGAALSDALGMMAEN